ncbi:uncharacterized protein LOC128678750 [Plodia interpunctella]|uniref:uncharacterized protein LOC128678750 n=1 Tax=Plodia interpunctella TaxID=58824 RepID=UPI002368E851|nr:uncharacterized protein LOC128678750 [Plodia interpunctella]
MDCKGCHRLINHDDNYLACFLCEGKFHSDCLNIKQDHFLTLTNEYRTSWSCPTCTNVTRRKGFNLNTPVRQHQIPASESTFDTMDVSCEIFDNEKPCTSDRFSLLMETLNQWRTDINANISAIRDDIRVSLGEIKSEIKSLRQDHASLKTTVSSLDAELKSLKCSVISQSEEQSDLTRRVDELSKTSGEHTSAAISQFELKIDALEQQARQCNIEICNVPERRNENLMGIVDAIGAVVKAQVTQRDIVSVHRVPHAQQGSSQPKNIIVKFMTRLQRDNFLSSFRKVKLLKTDKLGIPGTPTTIFINEHLTLKRKQLFRKCREAAREHHFKYVWIKNGTILLREKDDSPALAVRGEGDLARIFSTNNVQST